MSIKDTKINLMRLKLMPPNVLETSAEIKEATDQHRAAIKAIK